MKYLNVTIWVFLLVAGACSYTSYSQNTDAKSLIESKHYVFKPQAAMPVRGTTIQLTPEFMLKVTKDTITAYLPYFGRVFSLPANSAESGIKFTSTDFKYDETRKKRRWDITIAPNDSADRRDVRQLLLSANDNGYASLRIISTNRETISYSGYVTARDSR
jgi:hypothetical protein